jgi:hypothetical protein
MYASTCVSAEVHIAIVGLNSEPPRFAGYNPRFSPRPTYFVPSAMPEVIIREIHSKVLIPPEALRLRTGVSSGIGERVKGKVEATCTATS